MTNAGTRPELPRVFRTDVDGVPCYWSPVDGPVMAVLSFRVGTADERLASHGLTHLVEHLACRGVEGATYEWNASVSLQRTVFWARGSREEVAAFLRQVCARLASLPLDLLEDERNILSVEASSRGHGVWSDLADLRFGPFGAGLAGYREFGLHTADEESVAGWARSRFVREDAALWMTADPDGISLDLPSGVAHVPRDPSPLPVTTPAAVVIGANGVAVEMLGARSQPLSMAIQIAEKRAMARLRFGAAVAYSVESRYDPVGPGLAQAGLLVPCHREDEAETLTALERIVNQLASTGPDAGEMEQVIADRENVYLDPAAVPGILDELAEDLLLRGLDQDVETLHARARQIAAEAIPPALAEAAGTAFVCSSSGVVREGLPPYRPAPPVPIRGERFPRSSSRNLIDREFMVRGKEGIAHMRKGVVDRSMLFEDCELVLLGNGSRTMVGRDGQSLTVSASDWNMGGNLLLAIDAGVAPARFDLGPVAARPVAFARYRPQS